MLFLLWQWALRLLFYFASWKAFHQKLLLAQRRKCLLSNVPCVDPFPMKLLLCCFPPSRFSLNCSPSHRLISPSYMCQSYLYSVYRVRCSFFSSSIKHDQIAKIFPPCFRAHSICDAEVSLVELKFLSFKLASFNSTDLKGSIALKCVKFNATKPGNSIQLNLPLRSQLSLRTGYALLVVADSLGLP